MHVYIMHMCISLLTLYHVVRFQGQCLYIGMSWLKYVARFRRQWDFEVQ